MEKKCVGILGGMGPRASLDLFAKIIRLTKANGDDEHIHTIIDSNTSIPNRAKAILHGGADPLPQMTASAKRLEDAGAELLLIACNTAHYYYDGIASSVGIPVIHMLRETASECRRLGLKKVGLLATDMVLKTGIYHDALNHEDIEVLLPSPSGQSDIMRLVFDGVKKGNLGLDITALLLELDAMRNAGAEAFILGCTELPIAFEQYTIEHMLIDPTVVLACAAIRTAGYDVL